MSNQLINIEAKKNHSWQDDFSSQSTSGAQIQLTVKKFVLAADVLCVS